MEILQKPLRTKIRSKSKSPLEESMAKQVSTQTPPDIIRSLSAVSFKKKKTSGKALESVGIITRSDLEPVGIATPGVAANRITEKKFYSTDSLTDNVAERPVSLKTIKSNDKSQIVTLSSILRATQMPSTSNTLKSNIIARVSNSQKNTNCFEFLHLASLIWILLILIDFTGSYLIRCKRYGFATRRNLKLKLIESVMRSV